MFKKETLLKKKKIVKIKYILFKYWNFDKVKDKYCINISE